MSVTTPALIDSAAAAATATAAVVAAVVVVGAAGGHAERERGDERQDQEPERLTHEQSPSLPMPRGPGRRPAYTLSRPPN